MAKYKRKDPLAWGIILIVIGLVFLSSYSSYRSKSEYTNIIFYWPSGEKYPFEARAKRGEIEWKLPAELPLLEENGVSSIKAFTQEKEKPSIFLSTSYGTIRIEE